MTRQYKRAATLVAGDIHGNALDLSRLRFRFTIRQAVVESPNNAVIRVYNPAPATVQRAREEFSRVVVQAGYESAAAVLFDGTIVQARQGRENQTDTFLEIVAAEGDRAYCFSVVSKTLAPGYRLSDVHHALVGAMGEHGVTEGHTDDLGGPIYPRGRVLFGMAREYMRDLAQTVEADWWIDGSRVHLVKATGYLPDEVAVINSNTGLIGAPEQTPDGIVFRCLLNPRLKAGVRVKLDNTSIQEARRPVEISAQPGYNMLPSQDKDGIYRVLAVDHVGDTRGNDWYSEVVTVAQDAPSTKSQIRLGRD